MATAPSAVTSPNQSDQVPIMVARFFSAQHTKTGKYTKGSLNIPKKHNNIPNGHKIYQMAIKYTKNIHAYAFQNILKNGIFGLKICYLATMVVPILLLFRRNIFSPLFKT
jgi:hypothetical protein